MITYRTTKNNWLQYINKINNTKSVSGFIKDPEEIQKIKDSGVEIIAYTEPTKTIEQLQQEALLKINSIVKAECQSGAGKLYFSGLDSAARHTSVDIQPDAEIRARAVQLLKWDVAIDNYCDSVLFNISEGGAVPTLESFIAGLPTV